jgi:lactam utilization protein B
VKTIDGNWIPMSADTFCLHGDHPRALENLKKVLDLHQKQVLK